MSVFSHRLRVGLFFRSDVSSRHAAGVTAIDPYIRPPAAGYYHGKVLWTNRQLYSYHMEDTMYQDHTCISLYLDRSYSHLLGNSKYKSSTDWRLRSLAAVDDTVAAYSITIFTPFHYTAVKIPIPCPDEWIIAMTARTPTVVPYDMHKFCYIILIPWILPTIWYLQMIVTLTLYHWV